MRRTAPVLSCLGMAALGLVACRAPVEPVDGHLASLAPLVALGEVHRELDRLDLGTSAARRSLDAGWSWNERGGPDGAFVRARAERASIELWLTEARPVEIEMVGFGAPGDEPSPVAVEVGGERVADWSVGREVGSFRATLPERLLRAGPNRLVLVHTQRVRHGGREVGPGWSRLEVVGASPAAAEAVRVVGDRIDVAAGAAIDLLLPPDAPGRLELDGLRRGRGTDAIEVTLATDGLELAERKWTGGRIELSWPQSPDPLRLRIQAPPAADGGGASFVGSWTPPDPLGPKAARPAPPVAETPPLVLLYVVDTLRADRLGVYGGPEGLTPTFDRLAETADVYTDVVAQSSWTKSAMASVLTGLDPLRHGIHEPEHRLPDRVTTLAEELAAAGYRTAAFTANAHLTEAAGFAQGFETFHYDADACGPTQERALAWLDDDDGRPAFLWVHTIEPHAPYDPPRTLRARWAPQIPEEIGTVGHIRALGDHTTEATPEVVEQLEALYAGEVAAADRCFGELRRVLEERGQWEKSVVAVLSDHGDAFREHGVFGHGWDLHAETLRVPLLVKRPSASSSVVVERPAQHTDLPAIVHAAAAGVPWEAGTDDRPIVSHLDYEGRHGLSVTWGRWKLIEPRSGRFGPRRLYDRDADPGEQNDLAAERPILAAWLASHALAAETRAVRSESGELDPETEAELRALGYL